MDRISGPHCAVCSQESRIELLVKRAKSKLGANLGMKRTAKLRAADEQGLLEHTDKANLRYLQSRGWVLLGLGVQFTHRPEEGGIG